MKAWLFAQKSCPIKLAGLSGFKVGLTALVAFDILYENIFHINS